MKVEYSERALSDLTRIAEYCETLDNPDVGNRIASSINEVIERLAQFPRSGRTLSQRPGFRVVSLVRYPYRIFYRVGRGTIRIIHIRHTSRRPWPG
jgi:plasmid stabilization system protein ParE